MGNKRERLEVIYDILRIIREKNNHIKPTPLLRYSNLSFNGFNQYYEELLEKGFIKEIKDKKSKKYIILTDKGFDYLSKYNLIKEFMKDFELL